MRFGQKKAAGIASSNGFTLLIDRTNQPRPTNDTYLLELVVCAHVQNTANCAGHVHRWVVWQHATVGVQNQVVGFD